jgi:two-component system phosphate regulon sensor histidine kinase PhoR
MRLSAWDLRGLLDELVARARAEANPAGITLNLHLPDQPLPVYADREQLAQVFRNLLSNAIKFNQPHGWVVISARPNTEHIHVEISDSGIGIPAEDLPKLFQRFYRSRISVENEIQGTGLGLAIAREILQRHHGAVDVRSQVGSGTTFQITLPYDSSALPRN